MITAPFNFVPLNKEVFYPFWAKDVSHDVPFEDEESGVIDITITAQSPIFIRNHSSDKDKPSNEFCYFKNSDDAKEFYIPGSSIKGMIRSVLEIMSFSKIKIDEEKLKKSLSVRDMTNRRELVGSANGCGFLVLDDDKSYIEDCEKILTISHQDLKSMCGGIKKVESARAKYEKYGFQQIQFTTYTKMMDVHGRKIPKKMAKIDDRSTNTGTLVFTGDIGNKKNEFVFKPNGEEIPISDNSVVSDFKKVYFESEESLDGQFWKKQYKARKAKIPIFYTKNNNKIQALGLTQLFKLAYKKSLFDAAKQNTDNNKLDMAETIFGTQKDKLALKGRVQFSHLKADRVRFEKDEVEQVLGSPNPTYYPNYIRQTNTNGNKVNQYKTQMDEDAQISGWKRYPLQSNIQHYDLPQNGYGKTNHDVTTKFKPLDKGTIFHGKVRFHNLKKAEIGALLSALTFHGKNNNHKHNLGMAKSLGYGKISIQLNLQDLKYSQDDYLDSFEKLMDSWDTKEYVNWLKSPQMIEILSMSDVNNNKVLRYQQLENKTPIYGREKNDFSGAKKAKEFLFPFSNVKQKKEQQVTPNKNEKSHLVKQNPSKTDLQIVNKNSSTQNNNNSQQAKKPPKEYSILDIAKEVNTSVDAVLKFIQTTTLPISKKLNRDSTLKEAQAIGLINQMKKMK